MEEEVIIVYKKRAQRTVVIGLHDLGNLPYKLRKKATTVFQRTVFLLYIRLNIISFI